ncbi:DUF3224 domain-containing protein [Shewanella sp. OMA3-2]|uniref:DUF3224 domain-containing protein n=1 Tax=Shewanella sp. OMA3-2 TaxID=2908650 RepID=UPI001F1E2B8B|nr:DUF3224 domain-containing protein [Shewanella sp. OMA3-2]UJF23167.1 DUF3224 domain-containing protein [Shewanella sp. OMA3-2]
MMASIKIVNSTSKITAWDEKAYATFENDVKHTQAKISQHYTGELNGKADVMYLMVYQSATEAVFVGYETITATINNLSGTLTLQHLGQYRNGIASSEFTVVADSGRGDFTNIVGKGHFSSTTNGQAEYHFELKM